ncbi:MAG: sigma 54-interacting transcriptional regulator [Deltaproteobacteria bacterium]|nr:sigma 54-interacting transcriptional regulator [Deltaproteobacteria bacterium]
MGNGEDGLGKLGRYYRSLLDLNVEGAPEELLESALRLLVELMGAREGYIELDDLNASGSVQWCASHGCDAARVTEIQRTISRGIVAQTLASGEVVVTGSAVTDPRFQNRASVQDNAIEAVVCAPIARGDLRGVVYLQGSTQSLKVNVEAQRELSYFGRAITPFLEANLTRLRPADGVPAGGPFAHVRHRSRAMADVIERLRLVAPLDVDVLFTGATGVGKSLLARAVHGASRRAGGPFVEVNCAALPDALLENELFGAQEGAHSAVPRGGVVGKVEAADRGTLFLDEIGELSLVSQAKLLTLLQSRTYYRLGASKPSRADVRVLAATNAHLPSLVAQKRFRDDLYYRLNVLEVKVPSLAERVEDTPLLAAQLVRLAVERHALDVRGLSSAALRAVLHADWPGNVRELANRLESAVLNAHMRGSSLVEPRDLFPTEGDDASDEAASLQEAMRRFQKRYVLSVLEACDWNVSEAGRRLDVARSHVYGLMRLHGLKRET